MSKTAIITGGGRGIGYGIATCLAEKEINLVLADIDSERARESAAQLKKNHDMAAEGIYCDVTDRASVESCLKATLERFQSVDILINNAGICPFIDVMEMDEATFRKTLDVNLVGSFHCSQLVGQHMKERGKGGRIVYITSLSENVTGPQQVDYAASKGGLRMLMRGFATALGPCGITCNAVAPGLIYTDMTSWHWDKPENQEFAKKRIPLGRLGTPLDIGKAVRYLVSEDSEYINGITITVDGGHQAKSY